jgi:hypothetical protein
VLAVAFVRWPVVLLLVTFPVCFLLRRWLRERRWGCAALLVCCTLLVLLWSRDRIFDELSAKLTAYSGYAYLDSNVSRLQMRSLRELWKLPLSYLWATLQPLRLPLLGSTGAGLWWELLATLNLSLLPVAVANAAYLLTKKHDRLFFLLSTLGYLAVTALSLGVFRHYLFLLPLENLHAALYLTSERHGVSRLLLPLGSALLLLALALYSMLS